MALGAGIRGRRRRLLSTRTIRSLTIAIRQLATPLRFGKQHEGLGTAKYPEYQNENRSCARAKRSPVRGHGKHSVIKKAEQGSNPNPAFDLFLISQLTARTCRAIGCRPRPTSVRSTDLGEIRQPLAVRPSGDEKPDPTHPTRATKSSPVREQR